MSDPHHIAAKLLEDDDFDPKDYAMATAVPKYLLVWPDGFGDGKDGYYCCGSGLSGDRTYPCWSTEDRAFRFLTKEAAQKPFPGMTAVGTEGPVQLKVEATYE